jgi:hypothetical protein
MNRLFSNIFILSLIILVVFIGCEDSITSDYLDDVVIPDKNVSFSEYIQPVLHVKCGTSGCHDDESSAGNYSVSHWASVVTPGIVDAGNVETSRLVWRIEGLGVEFMPPIGSVVRPLTQNQVDGIKTWIREGARNN